MSDQFTAKQLDDLEDFEVQITGEAIPEQIQKNQSIEGRFQSVTTSPEGNDSNFGTGSTQNSNLKIRVSNADLLNLSSACICGTLVVTEVPAGDEVYCAGLHTLFSSISVEMQNKYIINIAKDADIVADMSLKMQSTDGELKKMKSKLLYKERIRNGTYTFRIPVKLWGEINNLLPTNSITTPINIEANLNNDKQKLLYMTGDPVNAGITFTINKFRLESDFIRPTPAMYNKFMSMVESNTGMTIPYHTYSLDSRNLENVETFTHYVPCNFLNIVSLVQTPVNISANTAGNYYDDLKFNADDINAVSDYLVNFDSSTFYQMNANKGLAGKAGFAEALDRVISTYGNNSSCSGATMVENIGDQQYLAVSFLKSQEAKSPYVKNSGINGKAMSGRIVTSAHFANPVSAGKKLSSLLKFTRKIMFRSGNMDIYN